MAAPLYKKERGQKRKENIEKVNGTKKGKK
jgi:hypothetical protein